MPGQPNEYFEHKTIQVRSGDGWDADGKLNHLGEQGWEVVTSYVIPYVQPEVYIVLKRLIVKGKAKIRT